MHPQVIDKTADSTLYHFGDNNLEEWQGLFQHYVTPPLLEAVNRGSLSFGLGGAGSGVPFHTHGAVFAEVLHGRKVCTFTFTFFGKRASLTFSLSLQRWFLYPGEQVPTYNPNETSLRWLLFSYPALSEEQLPVECTLQVGEVLYLPGGWHHATLNIGESVFMSTFV